MSKQTIRELEKRVVKAAMRLWRFDGGHLRHQPSGLGAPADRSFHRACAALHRAKEKKDAR